MRTNLQNSTGSHVLFGCVQTLLTATLAEQICARISHNQDYDLLLLYSLMHVYEWTNTGHPKADDFDEGKHDIFTISPFLWTDPYTVAFVHVHRSCIDLMMISEDCWSPEMMLRCRLQQELSHDVHVCMLHTSGAMFVVCNSRCQFVGMMWIDSLMTWHFPNCFLMNSLEIL